MKYVLRASLVVVAIGLMMDTPAARQNAGPVRITGWALSFGTVATGANHTIEITINRWSPSAERERLITAFIEKKQQGLLNELQRLPEMGRWRFPGYNGPDPDRIYTLGTPLRYAVTNPLPDGMRRVAIMTDRIMPFHEIRNRPRTYDYPFTLMEMRFDKSGKGEGRMLFYTQIRLDKKTNTIEFENYSSEPVRLNELKIEDPKR